MSARIEYARFQKLAAPTYAALISISKAIHDSHLVEPKIIELIKVRTSQINGCAFCLNMHVVEAREAGETDARLHVLAAWRESPAFTKRERAALAWAEAVTLLGSHGVPDEVFAEASAEFDDAALADLTAATITINAWNRIAVAYRFQHPVRS